MDPKELDRIDQAIAHVNSAGYDDWGLSAKVLKKAYRALEPFYTNYFRVETSGIENVPEGKVLLIANHSGQIPIDGLLIGMAMLKEANPPRAARGMVERWVPTLPFVSTFMNRVGQVVGDTKNCIDLLNRNECVLVFPEGVRGSGKPIYKRYQLGRFGTGFVHMALDTGAPIVPVAVIGCEESIPSFSPMKKLAKVFGFPYLPLSPTGMIPLPTKVTLRFGQPVWLDKNKITNESEVESHVLKIRQMLAKEIRKGLANRGEQIFTGSGLDKMKAQDGIEDSDELDP